MLNICQKLNLIQKCFSWFIIAKKSHNNFAYYLDELRYKNVDVYCQYD